MLYTVNDRRIINEVVEKNLIFPYYGWWDHSKSEIVKLDPVYYDQDKTTMSHINVIKIVFKFGSNISMIKSKIAVHHKNIIDDDINIILRDYSINASKEEYLKFREKVLKELI